MNYERCPRCNEFGRVPCHCQKFMIYLPYYFGEDKQEQWGHSFEEVAESMAKSINEDEPIFEENIFNEPIEITDEDGNTKKFNCTASISIDYSAEEIEP